MDSSSSDIENIDNYIKEYKKLFNKKKYDKLLEIIDKILQITKNNRFKFYLLKHKARCYSRKRDSLNAIKYFNQSLFFCSDIEEYKVIEESIAIEHYFNQEYDKAKELFMKLITNGTRNIMIYGLILATYKKKNEFNRAIDFIDIYVNINDKFFNDQNFLVEYSIILKEVGRYDEALKYLLVSKELKYNCYLYEEIGDCYFGLKEYNKAIEYYHKLTKRDRNYANVYLKLSKSYEFVNNLKKKNYYLDIYNKLILSYQNIEYDEETKRKENQQYE